MCGGLWWLFGRLLVDVGGEHWCFMWFLFPSGYFVVLKKNILLLLSVTSLYFLIIVVSLWYFMDNFGNFLSFLVLNRTKWYRRVINIYKKVINE